MNFLGIITARANSSRLFNKNLRKIKNKTLIEITIDFVRQIKNLDDIVLTSDSKKINYIAKQKKIKFVDKRPLGLSMKDTPSAFTVIHAIKWYEKKYSKVDSIALFQPTSPFRNLTFINKCIDQYIKYNKPIISVKQKETNYNSNLSDGSIYIIKKKDLFRLKSFNEKIAIKVISNSKKNSIDIDTINDLERAIKLSNINNV